MKMRTWYGAFFVVMIALGGAFFFKSNERVFIGEEPTMGEEDGEDREGRRAWLEFLFSGNDESYDWKTEYAKVTRNAAEKRNRARARQARGGVVPRNVDVAGGAVTGQWAERGAKTQAGRVIATDVLEAQELVVLGSHGGHIWLGSLAGDNYEILNDHMRFTIKSVHLFDNNGAVRVVVVASNGIYYTDNNGINWETAHVGSMLNATLSRTDNVLYAIQNGGIVVQSTDLGTSFTTLATVGNNGTSYNIWTPRYAAGELYVIAGSTCYTKSGNSFVTAGTITGMNSGKIGISGDNSLANGAVYVAGSGNSSTPVFKSTNGGATWSSAGTASEDLFNPSWTVTNNSFDAPGGNVLYVGGVHCQRSTNGGTSWGQVNSWTDYYDYMGGSSATKLHADICEVESYRNAEGTAFTLLSTDGGTYITYDHRNYSNITLTGLRNNQYYGHQTRWADPDIILAGAQDQGAQISQPENGNGIMDFYQYMSGDQGAYASSDSGQSSWFTYIYGQLYYHADTRNRTFYGANNVQKGSGTHLWMAPTVADPTNPRICYLGGTTVTKITFNGANSFSEATHATGSFDGMISALTISPVDNNHWYAATTARKFYHSSNRGVSWTQIQVTIPNDKWLVGHGIEADPVTLGTIYISGAGNGNPSVLRSTNHGANFAAVGTDVPTTAVIDLAANEDGSLLFAAAYDAPYVYVVADDRWYNISGLTAPDVPYFSVEYLPTIETVRFATHGRGIWDLALGEVVVPDPFLTLTAPAEGASFNSGDSLTVSWSENIEGMVTLSLLENGVAVEEIGHLSVDAGVYRWAVPELIQPGTHYAIAIRSETEALADTTALFALTNLKRIVQDSIAISSMSSEFSAAYGAVLALDGDSATFWHNATDGTDPLDAELVFELDQLYHLVGFSYLPRQDGAVDSRVAAYELLVSTDGTAWQSVQSGTWGDGAAENLELFADTTAAVNFVKFVASSATNGSDKASVAEFNLFYSEIGGKESVVDKAALATQLSLRSVSKRALSLSIPQSGTYRVQLLSLDGRLLFTEQREFSAGVETLSLQQAGLASQALLLRVSGGGATLTEKIRLQ